MMKVRACCLLLVVALTTTAVSGFAPTTRAAHPRLTCLPLASSTSADQDQELLFQEIAKKLRLSALHNGFDSKDSQYGIENVRACIPLEPSLGLELTEVASSGDGRGLVLVSHVGGNAAEFTSIAVGDSIVGVACDEAGFRQAVTGLDYDATIDAITQAKTHAQLMNVDSIQLQLNRLVLRARATVILESSNNDNKKKSKAIEALAGDNLRLVLMHHDVDVNRCGSHCGGSGSCGTCMVRVLGGQESLADASGKDCDDESPVRKACQTILGANNQESTVRIELS